MPVGPTDRLVDVGVVRARSAAQTVVPAVRWVRCISMKQQMQGLPRVSTKMKRFKRKSQVSSISLNMTVGVHARDIKLTPCFHTKKPTEFQGAPRLLRVKRICGESV